METLGSSVFVPVYRRGGRIVVVAVAVVVLPGVVVIVVAGREPPFDCDVRPLVRRAAGRPNNFSPMLETVLDRRWPLGISRWG